MPEEDFTVILPTYNEKGNILLMITSLKGLYPSAKILVMDDDSPDGTGETVMSAYSEDPGVDVIVRRGRTRGLTASVVDGISSCDTRFFIVMDADFQHPPESVRGLMDGLLESDLCIGVRRRRASLGFRRSLYSWGAEFLSHSYLWFIGKRSSGDNMSGFFGGRKEVIDECLSRNRDQLEIQGFKVLFDILKFLPDEATVTESMFDFGNRKEGESKIGSGIVLSILRQCGRSGKMLAGIAESLIS